PPRLFRLPEAEALINRLGFNNDGVDALTENIRRSRYRGILGINVGKNFDTPNERAADDYLGCLRKVYPHASFVTANVSSTNTTVSREGVGHLPVSRERGGLSGAPLKALATAVVAKLRRALPANVAVIGVGGIASAADAREKLDAGASLVQLYTALVYRGPG